MITTTEKVILITGASRGIGAATALLAASRGYHVCVNYVKNEVAANAIVKRVEEGGGKAFACKADVGEEEQVKEMFRLIDLKLGPITALVNNAGTLEHQSKLEGISHERFLRTLKNNILGTFLCSKEAISRMSIRNGGNGGSIVNVSSIGSKTGSPGEYIDYAASKGAIDSFTTGLSKEVAPEGIRVNAVRPGFIYTDIHESGGEPGRIDRIKSTIPMLRGGNPEEVANAILWLLSEEASYTTGAFIDIAGGR
ncbi:SDR family oxidoreductase [Sporocytophaga myxococcoides]|uniref:SDR family oxidoreductase n=1 Tax=Sporocytophaga myxococcoides TaxID=153721 RepID=UPI00041F59C8|nr:SDR family oxidoreductase [Sporocytophaga myxococcoides]